MSFGLIGILICTMSLITGWMFISSKFHYLIKITLSSFIVCLSIISWLSLQSVLGYPVADYPPDGVQIVSYWASGKTLFLWVLENGKLRSYAIPFQENLAKGLEAAEKNPGEKIIMKRRSTTHFHDTAPPVSITVIPSMPKKEEK